MAIDAGNFAAIPKSLNFHVFVFAEYRTRESAYSKGEITILGLQITMSIVEIVTSFQSFHYVAYDFPYFGFRHKRFVLHVSFMYIVHEIRVA